MRRLVLLVLLLLVAPATAQAPHPHEDLVHHPLTIEAELEAIRDINPPFIQMGSFGESVATFPLWKLEYVSPSVREDPARFLRTPVYYLDANHHGNEQLGMEALLIFMRELAEWSTTPEGAQRLMEVRVVAAPMINPDGTGTDKRVNTKGVDLNRNYDYNWGLYGTSDTMNPLTGNYRGDAPLSEPETQANAGLMASLRPDVYLSMHTGSHDIVLPWNQEEGADGPMPDWPLYEHWLGAIQNVSGLGYRDPSGAGESISFAYGKFGTLSLIVEVDQLQTEVLVEDIPTILKEEVAIFWDTLHRMETLGGWLVAEGGMVVNRGLGPAFNVVLFEGLEDPKSSLPPRGMERGGAVPATPPAVHFDVEPTLLAEVLVPGESVAVLDGLVRYERRIQGDDGPLTWSLRIKGTVQELQDADADTPLPVIVGVTAIAAALVLRRRPA